MAVTDGSLEWTRSVGSMQSVLLQFDVQYPRSGLAGSASQTTLLVGEVGGSQVLSIPVFGRVAPECPSGLVDDCLRPGSGVVFLSTQDALFIAGLNGSAKVGEFRLPNGRGLQNVKDIALSPAGSAYVCSDSSLFALDTTNANVRRLISLPFDPSAMESLDENSVLIAGSHGFGPPRLATVFLDGGVIEHQLPTDVSGDIARSPSGELFLSIVGSGGDDALASYELASGRLQIIGSLGAADVWGLAFWGAELWGFTGSGEALQLDGRAGSVVRSIGFGHSWTGAAVR